MMRPVTDKVICTFGLSERRACSLTGMNRSSYRYERKEADDDSLRDAIKGLAEKHSKYGYRMITLKLRQRDVLANHKRIERIYREEGLQLARKRKRRKTSSVIRNSPEPVTGINEEWAMDFVSDTLHDGYSAEICRQFRSYPATCFLHAGCCTGVYSAGRNGASRRLLSLALLGPH